MPIESALEKLQISILTFEVTDLDNLIDWIQSLPNLKDLKFEVASAVAFQCETLIE